MKYISTIEELIEALGGHQAVMGLTGQRSTTISNWKKRGLPADWHRWAEKEAQARGFAIAESLLAPRRRGAA